MGERTVDELIYMGGRDYLGKEHFYSFTDKPNSSVSCKIRRRAIHTGVLEVLEESTRTKKDDVDFKKWQVRKEWYLNSQNINST